LTLAEQRQSSDLYVAELLGSLIKIFLIKYSAFSERDVWLSYT